MTSMTHPTSEQDRNGLLGARFIYTYANGWRYEMYVKNATTIDYRIHSGMVGGRWVKDQTVDLVQLDVDMFKISWTEPTGTSVCVTVSPQKRQLHGVIFFPRWVQQHPERTVCFQNDHLDAMRAHRDEGPTHPLHVVPEFARITYFEHVGQNDETAVSTAPEDLPAGFTDRRN